jgi:hypothetical protein
MRESFLVSGGEWIQRLSGPDYEGSVELEIQIISAKNIHDYSPSGVHDDYDGEKFNIKKGEVLAIGGRARFHVDKVYDPLKAPVSSLIKIKEGEHKEGPFNLLLEDELIFVLLSKLDWKEYPGIRDRVPALLHGTLVLPVLAEAISNIHKHQSTLWAGRLQEIIDAKGIDTSKPLSAAQLILASPLQRTLQAVNVELDKKELL